MGCTSLPEHYVVTTKLCTVCGEEFETRGRSKIRCDACQKKYRAAYQRQWMRDRHGHNEGYADEHTEVFQQEISAGNSRGLYAKTPAAKKQQQQH